MSCFRLIEAERASFSVPLMCRMLGVSRSGYYDWRHRPPSEREKTDAGLTERICEIHNRSRGTYGYPNGYPRIHAELRSVGIRCGRLQAGREADARSRASRLPARPQEAHHSQGRCFRPCPGSHPRRFHRRGTQQVVGCGHHLRAYR